jgi:hypothetical protein
VFVLLGFSPALVQSFLAIFLFLPFGMGMFTVCQFILEVCNLFLFTGVHSYEFSLSLKRDFGLGQFGTVITLETLGNGPKYI